MEYLILGVLIILAILLFSFSARQKKILRNRREKILMRLKERRLKENKEV